MAVSVSYQKCNQVCSAKIITKGNIIHCPTAEEYAVIRCICHLVFFGLQLTHQMLFFIEHVIRCSVCVSTDSRVTMGTYHLFRSI